MKTITAIVFFLTLATVSFAQNNAGSTTYRVVATQNGNTAITSVSNTIEVSSPSSVFIPNAFTPDGDGINDTWMPVLTNVDEVRLSVFNRWGEEIFTGSEGHQSWDGTFNGESVPQGVYVYQIRAWSKDHSKWYDYSGSVTLVK
ncbi:MAG: gliding motility-associated C-terminal domain-containing protein [Flavobacteriales bacterium]|nr:gliding motility-associated C-terminal domain-containing protein [Flavobacteriales bacterium]